MLDRWQVVRTAAGAFGKPGELADLWSDDLILDGAAPVVSGLAAVASLGLVPCSRNAGALASCCGASGGKATMIGSSASRGNLPCNS